MAKLYPPYIEEKLPAQIVGEELKIPFQPNRAVSLSDIQGIQMKIKTVSTNLQILNLSTTKIESGYAIFEYNEEEFNKLTQGQFYKVQLACINEEDIGYFSTVGIFKYTTNPKLTISINLPEIIGQYSQEERDVTEKIYSYSFDIYSTDGVLFASSGTKIHNSNQDTSSNSSLDSWILDKQLIDDKEYICVYTVNTINNLTRKTSSSAFSTFIFNGTLSGVLYAENEYNNSFISLYYNGNDSNIKKYLLSRASSKDNFQIYYNLSFINDKEYKDYNIEQGVFYKYIIQGINLDDSYTEKNESNIVYADFEDMFLYGIDGKQLKIKYNPKVTSFRTILSETKVDTIGGKHPFIFRNANIEYKELALSGLISHLSDENEIFISKKDIGVYGKEPYRSNSETNEIDEIALNYHILHSTQLNSNNVYVEREFKTKVLDWLNDGEIKLFKSPTEGNYLIRLMNVSLTPNDTLGRMLHTFNCNAYEIADYDIKNLKKYNFI